MCIVFEIGSSNLFVDVATLITAVVSSLAVIVSIVALRYSVKQFKVSQIVSRQQFLYNERIDVYTMAFQMLSSVEYYQAEIQNVIDHLDDCSFDPKVLFCGLCNNRYMQSEQRAANVEDSDAQRDYMSKMAHIDALVESLPVLFDFRLDLVDMITDIVSPYISVLGTLRLCIIAMNVRQSSVNPMPVIAELEGKSDFEKLKTITTENKLCENLEKLTKFNDAHTNMSHLVHVLLFIRNDLYAETKKKRLNEGQN